MTPYLLLAGLLALSCGAFAQDRTSRRATTDSLVRETERARDRVDSLRKSAMRQDTIIESMTRMVDFYKRAGDSANTKSWRNTLYHYMTRFDSTLRVLDSAIGRLSTLSNRLEKMDAPNTPPPGH